MEERFDMIQEVEKFNPYHDARGRFTFANSATSFTIRTRAKYQQGQANRSIERAKEKYSAQKPKSLFDGKKNPKKPATRKPKQPKEDKPKLSRKESAAQKTRDFIKRQTNIDIEDYRNDTTRHFDNTKYVNVDWKNMPRNTRSQIQQLANSYGGSLILHDNGWMKAIERVKKK